MIVETMSNEEIVKEFNKAVAAHPFSYEILDLKKIRRFFIKNKNATNIFMKPIIYTIDKNSKLYVIPFLENKKSFENRDVCKLRFMTYRTSHGISVVKRRFNPILGSSMYTFTSSHFFDRYRERHLKNNEMSKIEVIIDFYKKNFKGDIMFLYIESMKKEICSFVSAYDTGMAMGTFESDEICLYKTYIDPSDMSEFKKNDLEIFNAIKSKIQGKRNITSDYMRVSNELYERLKYSRKLQEQSILNDL